MAAAAAGVEVDIPLVELFLAELFVEEAEREYMKRSFMYLYTKEGQELRQIMSSDHDDLGPYMENEDYWEWVMGGDDWKKLYPGTPAWHAGYRRADDIDWVSLFQRENDRVVVDLTGEERGMAKS